MPALRHKTYKMLQAFEAPILCLKIKHAKPKIINLDSFTIHFTYLNGDLYLNKQYHACENAIFYKHFLQIQIEIL